MKGGLSYQSWLKTWKRSGALKHPDKLLLKLVLWKDAAAKEDAPTPPVRAMVVGWLVDADDEAIYLAMETFEDNGARDYMTIPAGMITGVFDIAEVPGFSKAQSNGMVRE